MENGGASNEASDFADDMDAHTVFVRSLPFSLTDSQLEDIFSEVGPVRHCFTVKEKGSAKHRGFGFVQFAVTEDAHRAVQEKNGALLQGRKIKVEVAKRRVPLDVRHPKSDSSKPEPTTADEEQPSISATTKLDSKKRKSTELQSTRPVESAEGDLNGSKKKLKPGVLLETGEKANEEPKVIKKKEKPGGKLQLDVKAEKSKDYDESQGSSKQRPARTVVVGGVASTEMLEAILAEAKKVGPVESVQKTFTDLELSSRGLAKDGCKQRAAAIIFFSVKAARQAVAAFHQKTMPGGVVWARQLGGEGSKLKQLRLIVRNLPFKVSEATLRELFSPAGFLWEVTIPRKPDGLSKGFAFIGFTSKVDAEKAIKLVNGKLVAKRPVAVDWAVGKKQYEAAVAPAATAVTPDVEDENESTASESESNDSSGNGVSLGNDQETGDESEHLRKDHVVAQKQPISDGRNVKRKRRSQEGLISEEYKEEIDGLVNKSGDIPEDNRHTSQEMEDRMEEIDMVRKVLTKVVQSVHDHPSDDEIVKAFEIERPDLKPLKDVVSKVNPTKKVASNRKTEAIGINVEGDELSKTDTDDAESSKLSRTVFLRNLPVEAKVPELRKLFSEFGEIKSFRLVINPVTKKSKGNAFLEYANEEAAQAAVGAAAKSGSDDLGLTLKGRAVSVSMAVDKDSARKIAKETFHKQVEEDKRNLALAKEGQILEGTPAAAGVSNKDMAKRQELEHEKTTKLRSPNFHVSRTRLLVHNIPKTMADKELKKLLIDGVKSRASKQNPVVKQVKILQDEDSGKSRGVAFVEFTEHQHALVALRVLNNNPATFGADKRPIVEFAIENSLILRKRAANAVQTKKWLGKGAQGQQTSGASDVGKRGNRVGNVQKQKRRQGTEGFKSNKENDNFPDNGRQQVEGKSAPVKEDRKRKRQKDGHDSRKTFKEGQHGAQEAPAKDSPSGDLQQGGQREMKAGRKMKRGKTSGADRKAAQAKKSSSEAMEGSVEPAVKKPRTNSQKLGKKGMKDQKDRLSEQAPAVMQPNVSRQQINPKEGKSKNSGFLQKRGSHRETQVKSKKQRNRGQAGDTQDSVDMLAAEYRKKLFPGLSRPSAPKGVTSASGDLRRWFE